VDTGGDSSFRRGRNTAVFLIFLAAFFPIVVACISGVANVPAIYRRAGRNFGLTAPQLAARVVFPAALPQIIVGLRIALGIAWLVVVAAEMIAVDSGLGYLVIDATQFRQALRPGGRGHADDRLIGLVLDLGFRSLKTIRSVRWGFRDES
jgi:NitT/TauT family transport system permease protein